MVPLTQTSCECENIISSCGSALTASSLCLWFHMFGRRRPRNSLRGQTVGPWFSVLTGSSLCVWFHTFGRGHPQMCQASTTNANDRQRTLLTMCGFKLHAVPFASKWATPRRAGEYLLACLAARPATTIGFTSCSSIPRSPLVIEQVYCSFKLL